MYSSIRGVLAAAAAGGLCLAGTAAAVAAPGLPSRHLAPPPATATPIQHLVVIFDENVSFDHYFGTYPQAANTDGNPFHASPGTPSVNGLTPALLAHNPNSANPQRLTSAQALTCDQNHAYTAEQAALDAGLLDKFVQATGRSTCPAPNYSAPGLVMDYYDGNTVTGLWNYAQRYAMSDNFYGTVFGPSTPGALNLIAGQTADGTGISTAGQPVADPNVVGTEDANFTGTVYSDQDPYYDGCSNRTGTTLKVTGTNIGDMLNAKGITWGWFQGGFAPTGTTASGGPVCGSSHANIGGVTVPDYSPHHNPFEYYASTANPDHTPPAGVAEIGRGGPANHQYDLSWFGKALGTGNLPAVSYLKASEYQDGHAGYSDPTDEQTFLVNTINAIQHSRYWRSTAIMITYDDTDGWYDHAMPPVLNSSGDPALDALNGPGACGHGSPLGGIQDRCGYGERMPFLLVSPYARTDYVSNTTADQSSILAFIEDNWLGGRRISSTSYDNLAGSLNDMFRWDHPDFGPFLLDPGTGEATGH
jgi:phospholipase C